MEKQKKPSGKECAVCRVRTVKGMPIHGQMGTAKNLSALLKKYGEITVTHGVMCMKCVRRVLIIHKHVTEFHALCHKPKPTPSVRVCNPQPEQRNSASSAPIKIVKVYSLKVLPSYQSLGAPRTTSCRRLAPKPQQDAAPSTHSVSLDVKSPLEGSLENLYSPQKEKQGIVQAGYSPVSPRDQSVVAGSTPIVSVSDHCSGNLQSAKRPKLSLLPDATLETAQFGDHTYGCHAISAAEVLNKHGREWLNLIGDHSNESLGLDYRKILLEKIAEGSLKNIAIGIMQIPELRARILAYIMSELSSALSRISNRKHGNLSCLKPTIFEDTNTFDWNSILREMDTISPELLKLCMAMLFKPMKSQLNSEQVIQEAVPKIGVVFAILVQGRIKQLTRVQRVITLLLRRNGCVGKSVWKKMNSIGLSLSYTSMISLLQGLHASNKPVSVPEINEDRKKKNRAKQLAPENTMKTKPRTRKVPAKKPILRILRRQATPQLEAPREVHVAPREPAEDNVRRIFSPLEPDAEVFGAMMDARVVQMCTMASDYPSAQINTGITTCDMHTDINGELSESDFTFEAMTFLKQN